MLKSGCHGRDGLEKQAWLVVGKRQYVELSSLRPSLGHLEDGTDVSTEVSLRTSGVNLRFARH